MNQENIFDGGYSFMSIPCSISYLFTNKSVRTYALHIFSLSIYPMKLHEFFFFLQALAGIFFSSSIPCMNFFFGSDTPPPRTSNGPPLTRSYTYQIRNCLCYSRLDDTSLSIELDTALKSYV